MSQQELKTKLRRHIMLYLIALGKNDTMSAELHKGMISMYAERIEGELIQ